MRTLVDGVRVHLRLAAPLMGIVATMWVLRMVVSEAGASLSVVRCFSVTATVAVCVLLGALQIHLNQAGGFAGVVGLSFLLNAWAQILIVGAIGFSHLTGTENIYSHATFALRVPGTSHIYSQLTFVLGTSTLFGAAMGCSLLVLLRLILPGERR